MNQLLELGPSTAQMDQRPKNPFSPGDRVQKRDGTGDEAIVIERVPPENLIMKQSLSRSFPNSKVDPAIGRKSIQRS